MYGNLCGKKTSLLSLLFTNRANWVAIPVFFAKNWRPSVLPVSRLLPVLSSDMKKHSSPHSASLPTYRTTKIYSDN